MGLEFILGICETFSQSKIVGLKKLFQNSDHSNFKTLNGLITLLSYFSTHLNFHTFWDSIWYTVGELKDWTKRNLWSKTTLNTGGMGGARVDPPTCKMGTFFLMSQTLTELVMCRAWIFSGSGFNFFPRAGRARAYNFWSRKSCFARSKQLRSC